MICMKQVINVAGAAFIKCGRIFAAKRSYGLARAVSRP